MSKYQKNAHLNELIRENARLRKLIGDGLKHEFFIVSATTGKIEKAMDNLLFMVEHDATNYCVNNGYPETWVRRLLGEFVPKEIKSLIKYEETCYCGCCCNSSCDNYGCPIS